ncbi:FAD-dependent oxidoreductase [Rhodovulum sp. 12E13]|uniref:NAD(P)/FAD-dependent oxidoreductase n=1 Tax=Rhodovulum sp. 12E13 TaxID=2203891 RepID=UPI000E12EAEA|nr:FAD-binding oxidoreductase [Rhodovulum sp. 12E13]RDC68475.1 FAD-dependent oxidoreductase [Rhodovulum sp. 12E13]
MTAYAARRLPKQPGVSGWSAILPARAPSPPLDSETTADVAIVGAGFAGLSAARRLAQLDPACRVVVCEAGEVGHGPAGRNTGFMIDLPHDLASESYAGSAEADRRKIAENRIAIRFAAALAEETQMPREVFDPCGKINAAATAEGDAHNRAFAQHLSGLGEPSALLDAGEMHEITGSRFYRSGLHTPGAAMIQPAAYIRRFADALPPAVRLHERSPVTRIARAGSDWRVETRGGAVTAPRVVLATNGHAESFGYLPRRLMHVFTYASMTRALSPDEVAALGGRPAWAVTPADPMGTTVRRISGTGGDRIVVRCRFTYDPGMEVTGARIARVGRLHDAKFADRFPMLRGVAMEHRWAGHLCLTWNGVPGFGLLDDGIVAAVAQNGLGTVQGTLSGLAAAETVLDRPGDAAAAFEGHATARRLPPEPAAWIGANAVMRWREMRAGRE